MFKIKVYSQSSDSGVISTIRDKKSARNCVLFSAICRRLQYSLQTHKQQQLCVYTHTHK